MKIILFDGTFKTTTFINRLARGLSKNHEIFILGFNEGKVNKLPNVYYIPLGANQNNVRLVVLSFNYAIKTSIYAVFKLIKHLTLKNKKIIQKQNLDYVLNKINPDIIHLQWISNINFFESYINSKKYKFVLSQRGYQINIRPFVNKSNFDFLKDWFPKIDGFHSVSKAIQKVSKNIYDSEDKIDHVVYSGLDLEKFHFQKNKKKSLARIELISVGRDHWIKGYEYVLKAIAILKQKNIPIHYTIVGVSTNSEELLYYIDYFNLKDDVSFITSLNQSGVYKLIHKKDVLILPSIEEGIANVCLEAMALGTFVISTDCGGMKELVKDNETGFMCSKRSSEELVNKIIKFHEYGNDVVNNIRINARVKVEKQHNKVKMINDMEALYKTVYESS